MRYRLDLFFKILRHSPQNMSFLVLSLKALQLMSKVSRFRVSSVIRKVLMNLVIDLAEKLLDIILGA